MANRAPDYFFRENGKVKPGFASSGRQQSHAARPKRLKTVSGSGSGLKHWSSYSKEQLGDMPITDAAKLLRQELKEKFPDAIFSVRSDKYSMGSSIDVIWVDGPATDKVEPIVRKYKSIPNYDPSTGDALLGGNRFAFTHRRYSKGIMDRAREIVATQHGAANLTGYEKTKIVDDHLWPYLQGTDYPPKPVPKKGEPYD